MLGKVVCFARKLTVKYVLIPIAITAATAVVLEKLAARLEGDGLNRDPEGEPYHDLADA